MLALEADRRLVDPNAAVLRITQERILEKTFVRECGIPTAAFAPVLDRERIRDGAGDGRVSGGPQDDDGRLRRQGTVGRARPRRGRGSARGSARARADLGALIPFDRELSIIATRDEGGDVVSFPVSENVHDHGVLAMTIVPGRVSAAVADRAHAYAHTIATRLGIVGTFCVEFFQVGDELLVNEIAPRVHNSGHYSLDATQISQYELHVRAICGLPLVEPSLFAPAVMVNILGTGEGNRLEGVREILRDPDLKLHVYGKTNASLRRKMAHFTVLGESIDDAIARAERAKAALHWADDRVTSRT